MENKYCMIETAFDNEEEVNKVVNELIENKLVASCQVVNSNSKWNWNKTIEGSHEYLVFMKTKKEHGKEIYDIIRKTHSYECFEFAMFDLTSYSQDYLNWIETETK